MNTTFPVDPIEQAATAAHEVNAAYCRALGDHSQPSWADAPDWQKNSARAGVEAIIRNPAMTPEESHLGWLEEKRKDGWRYGPVKDPSAKEHPCFVPYHKLPPEQQAKDALFQAAVRGVLGFHGVM